ncbi:hypothetical protein A1O3_07348 [Capronia epimyces CBS 606.96]|uniref:Uncharacterized protein n=1 Tax=Capronia epimyces CBS 606.96 TaxID=1182542 RepID=W9XUN9_9EURO|nr:uncharacterized protein A1O3_07348 [Capronia epimyces CBS 606.96]EXJ81060.1 hypothetical protein A1O3_07348 [Capronia epimyces CBS 606.96]
MQPLLKDAPSYFDYTPWRPASSEAHTPSSEPISPGSSRKVTPLSKPGRGSARSPSEYGAVQKRIRVRTISEDQGSHSVPIQGSSRPRAGKRASSATVGRDRRDRRHPVAKSSLEESAESVPVDFGKAAPGTGLDAHDKSPPHTPSRPPIGHGWARSTSGSVWFRIKQSSSEVDRPLLSQTDSERLIVRTDQTPLRPPAASSSSTAAGRSTLSAIKVETEFTDSDPKQQRPVTQPAELLGDATARKGSFNPLHFFSAPFLLVRRSSLLKRQSKTKVAEARITPPEPEDPLLADHRSLLKRNYTSEALSRVSAILQEMKHSPQGSLRPSAVIKPLRWRTFSDKWNSMRADKDHLMVPGVTDHLTAQQRKSIEQLSDTRSYTSSERNLLMGRQPNNSPAEQATYRVKRSASAETEEFLKVDISIRGGTSYLPSEARRIHTPPLPEEGIDGRWRGFFFDYNAPGRAGKLRNVGIGRVATHSDGTSPESVVSESPSASTAFGRKEALCKGKNRKRIMGGDWYDVKLAELELGNPSSWSETINAKEEERRVNLTTLEGLSKGQRRRGERHFDLTIPEHLPSSPLCPRNHRYWRVVAGKGSQFRGCWMHGVGVYNGHDHEREQEEEGDGEDDT